VLFRAQDDISPSCYGYPSCNSVEERKETIGEKVMNIKRISFIILGCIGVGLGAVGAVVPMLPSFPFLLLAAFSFARSSEKLERWFKGTKLYKNNLENYVVDRSMTRKTKIRVMITITLLMSVGFVMMGIKGIIIGCIVLALVWLFHIAYFCFGVKTIPENKDDDGV